MTSKASKSVKSKSAKSAAKSYTKESSNPDMDFTEEALNNSCKVAEENNSVASRSSKSKSAKSAVKSYPKEPSNPDVDFTEEALNNSCKVAEENNSVASRSSKSKSAESPEDMGITEEVLKGSFKMEEGMQMLIMSHIKLNRKVGLFNVDLASLAKIAKTLDVAMIDIENRLRKLEGRTDFNYKSFLEDILSSANISEELRFVADTLLSLGASIDSLREGGKGLAMDQEKLRELLLVMGGSGSLLDKLGLLQHLETLSMTSSQLRKLRRRQRKGYDEEGSSMDLSSVADERDKKRKERESFLSYQGVQRWDEEYAESLAGMKVRRIPGVSYDTYERSLHPFKCRKCGKIIEKSEKLITALVHVEINYFLGENPTGEDINLFTCRICGLPVTSEQFIREHVSSHIDNNQVCYCLKCQKENNETEDSYDNIEEETPDLSLQTMIKLDDKAFTHSRHDITFAPHCANCNREFNYLVPLVKKIVVHGHKSTSVSSDETKKFFYVCLVCGMKKSYKPHIELHALSHIENQDLYCDKCDVNQSTKKSERTLEEAKNPDDFTLELLSDTKEEKSLK